MKLTSYMKVIFSMSFMFLLAVNSLAQQKTVRPEPTDLLIVSQKSYLPIPEKGEGSDPFKALSDQRQAHTDLVPENRALLSAPSLSGANAAMGYKIYNYELKLKNTGQKTIHKIMWRYLFVEPTTKKQIGERVFVSRVNIQPGKTQKLIESSSQHPIKKYHANQKDKKSQVKTFETVVLFKIEYADGSVWNAT